MTLYSPLDLDVRLQVENVSSLSIFVAKINPVGHRVDLLYPRSLMIDTVAAFEADFPLI